MYLCPSALWMRFYICLKMFTYASVHRCSVHMYIHAYLCFATAEAAVTPVISARCSTWYLPPPFARLPSQFIYNKSHPHWLSAYLRVPSASLTICSLISVCCVCAFTHIHLNMVSQLFPFSFAILNEQQGFADCTHTHSHIAYMLKAGISSFQLPLAAHCCLAVLLMNIYA